MDSENPMIKVPRQIEATLNEIPWTRSVAAGSLVVGAVRVGRFGPDWDFDIGVFSLE